MANSPLPTKVRLGKLHTCIELEGTHRTFDDVTRMLDPVDRIDVAGFDLFSLFIFTTLFHFEVMKLVVGV